MAFPCLMLCVGYKWHYLYFLIYARMKLHYHATLSKISTNRNEVAGKRFA